MITYHVGDATRPELHGAVTIAHILSDTGAYAKGFAKAIAERHPIARERFQAWARGTGGSGTARPFTLGSVQWVGVGHDLGRSHRFSDRWVANMVAQQGLYSKTRNPHPLDLDALELCLRQLADEVRGPIAMPLIGCGLAGGNWDEVEPLISSHLKAQDVHVYRLEGGVREPLVPKPKASSRSAISSSADTST